MLKMIFLSDAERAWLIAPQHRRERIKAVLLFDKGWSIVATAEALLLSKDAIREHINEYRESKQLKPENGSSVQKLSTEHSDLIVKHLQSHIYPYVKDIVAYVQSTWPVTYSIPGMHNWLQRYGF